MPRGIKGRIMERGKCPKCSWRLLEPYENARGGYRPTCQPCRARKYTMYKKPFCEQCGFKAINAIQLDVDHIDGDNTNNKISNLRTLCANCHRLKTWEQSDFRYGIRKKYKDKELT